MIVLLLAVVTAYAIGDGYTPGHITASGLPVRPGVTIACSEHYDIGSYVWIEGFGVRRCEDRGKAIVGQNRFDIAMHSPEAARQFGKRLLRYSPLRSPQPSETHRLNVWRGKEFFLSCSYTPMHDGAYTAGHCLSRVRGPGWTVYAGHNRVNRFGLDAVRDLAHIPMESRQDVVLRHPLSGDIGYVRGGVFTSVGMINLYYAVDNRTYRQRLWCGDVPFTFGASGEGIYADDGALLGVVVGIPLDNRCFDGYAIYSEDVP